MENPEYGTFEYFKIPGNREEFIKRTGFVDTLAQETAKFRRGIVQPNCTSDIHTLEPMLPAEC